MKIRLVFMIVIMVLLINITVVQAGRPDHSLGAVFGEQELGHLVMWNPEAGCGATLSHDQYDINDFVRVNPDWSEFSKINEIAMISYYDRSSEVWHYGNGHLTRNWNCDDEGCYGVWMHARGYVTIGSETKELNCKFSIDETTLEMTYRIKLR
jgi:hypothetical protein